ncbi:MAG TPA: glycosyltransferase, partial [Coriobacteriia bacterium]
EGSSHTLRARHCRPRPDGGEPVGWTYAVPGVVSWSVIAACVLGLVFFQPTWQWIAAGFVAYLMLYMWVMVAFALIAELKLRRWAKRDWTAAENEPGPFGFAPADVHHAVVVPNFKEPLNVLERTIEGLAVQHRASERIVLVLGMEEREPGAREKGEALARRYEGRFERIIVSLHPGGLPGELACKASNQSWASIEARRVTVEEMGIPLEHITLSTCDADSVFHPKYFAALSEMFARDERRDATFWQAPLLYYNNIWDVPAPIRYSTWFIHAGQLAELANPIYEPLPISTYTLSMRLAEQMDWWDPAVISEDWHVYLGAMFALDGDVSVTSVFLPVSADATDGKTTWQALINRYLQVLRHAWGAEDVGYILKSMIAERRLPRPLTAFRFVQVLHDHVMRVAGWCGLVSGYVLSFLARDTAFASVRVESATGVNVLGTLFAVMFTVGGVGIASVIVVELLRNPPPRHWPFLRSVLEIALMWFSAPFIGLFLAVAPAVHAQTKLMFGLPLAWRVTPKRLVERFGDAA